MMIDRTDLQLMLIEEICEMGTEELIEVFGQLTGNELEIYNDETESIIGSVEILDVSDPPQLKKMLGFFLYVLGERVQMQAAE